MSFQKHTDISLPPMPTTTVKQPILIQSPRPMLPAGTGTDCKGKPKATPLRREAAALSIEDRLQHAATTYKPGLRPLSRDPWHSTEDLRQIAPVHRFQSRLQPSPVVHSRTWQITGGEAIAASHSQPAISLEFSQVLPPSRPEVLPQFCPQHFRRLPNPDTAFLPPGLGSQLVHVRSSPLSTQDLIIIDLGVRHAGTSVSPKILRDNRLVFTLPGRAIVPSRTSHNQSFDDTMKIQFTYLAIIVAAAGVKAALSDANEGAYGKACLGLCYRVQHNCSDEWSSKYQSTSGCWDCCKFN
ncbi:uncharacterized protein EDB91DRAFT_1337678 [Suillus paluster]|uniref:uncharacterized protein n=1 Tax=Suillus paluster TaxID=48578 RepID=UPI001B862553|nr:uncharacterized protein EDB91DRAFT_1337678 [Suillus paluster]KAG1735325.1 hypothetical protein EDB91DRAFT_1337678 [Suillus paluster]